MSSPNRTPNEENSGSDRDTKAFPDTKPEPAKKSSRLKTIWVKLGLNPGILLLMAKGAMPPVIAMSMYQATSIANLLGNLGYLAAIIATVSFGIMPRAKFIQTMILNLVGVSLASAVSLLAVYCVVKARLHTTPRAPSPAPSAAGGGTKSLVATPYNSSSSAVAGIWLFVLIYAVNTAKAKFPALQFPGIIFSIFVVVSMTYSPLFPNMEAGLSFMRTLLTAFSIGFAVAICVSLFIFPLSCRTIVLKEMTGYFAMVRGTLKAQSAYLKSLEQNDVFGGLLPKESEAKDNQGSPHAGKGNVREETPETKALKAAVKGLTDLHSKLRGDMSFAKREIGWGKLRGNDLEEIYKLLRILLLPIVGMSTVTDIFERIAEIKGWPPVSEPQRNDAHWEDGVSNEHLDAKREWNQVMQALRVPFENVMTAMDEGLVHASTVLELAPKEKKQRKKIKKKGVPGTETSDIVEDPEDVEATAVPKPGDPGFAVWMEGKIKPFSEGRAVAIKEWCLRGHAKEEAASLKGRKKSKANRDRDLRRLWLILNLEHLLYCASEAVLDLVHFADAKVADGTLKRKRLIFPGAERLKKWAMSTFKDEDTSLDHQNIDNMEVGAQLIDTGEGKRKRLDPEHLPPKTSWQRFGNLIRHLPHLLSSPESAYGFRVACAVMTVGVLAYLRVSRLFFFEQRLLWSMIIISIGMSMTAGSSIFGFIGRVLGSLVAMVFSIINWYIVDGKTGGVLPLLYVFILFEFYFLIKYPRFIIVALLGIVTQVLIIGYELEVRKLGLQKVTSNGQPAYAIFLLAPYRLATVVAGSFIAFFWTIFPFPITDRSQLRQNLGASLFLLANLYSCVHTTVVVRFRGFEGDMKSKHSPGRLLQKNRIKVYGKCFMLVESLKQHSAFTAFEPTIGGEFPKAEYDAIITEVEHIMNYIALIGYATKSLNTSEASESTWIKDLAKMIRSVNITSNEITSMLSILSNSISNAQPLPPHLRAPSAYKLKETLEAIDPKILSPDHITEPGYSAFAVMQVASTLIQDDLEKLIVHVRNLVGVVDFTFQVVPTDNSDSSDETLWKEATRPSEKGKKE